MAPARSFDYEYLRELLRELPRASLRWLAERVTAHEREVRRDPSYPAITPTAIASVRDRYRGRWGLPEDDAPRPHVTRSQPYQGIPAKHLMDLPLRRARTMARIARKQTEGIPPEAIRATMNYAENLFQAGRIIDLDANGVPQERPARPDELDDHGHLALMLSPNPGLTDDLWKRLSPQERRIASMRFRPDENIPIVTPAELGVPVSDRTPADLGKLLTEAIRGASSNEELAHLAHAQKLTPELLEHAGRDAAADILRELIAGVLPKAQVQAQDRRQLDMDAEQPRPVRWRASG